LVFFAPSGQADERKRLFVFFCIGRERGGGSEMARHSIVERMKQQHSPNLALPLCAEEWIVGWVIREIKVLLQLPVVFP
jgi:hypothetical protein